jgi:DSF synthase
VIVDRWAETALGLTNRDLRLMERLARAQARKVGGGDEGAVEEIKRMELDTAWGELGGGGGSTMWRESGTGITEWSNTTH